MNPNYKAIKDWPSYEISNLGDVRRNNKPISHFLNNHGYLCFNVSNGSRRKMLRVHREVARAFLDQSGNLVRHLDGNKLNCCLSNIAWGNNKDNEADKRSHGRLMQGEGHHQHKLTTEQVLDIRKSQKSGLELSKKYSVSNRTIWLIRMRRTWRHL